MPHQCVRCGKFFEDGSNCILKGCQVCNGKLFFYVKQEKLEQMRNAAYKLSKKDKEQIEKDVFDIIGLDRDKEQSVVLDFEAIRVLSPGKYELDLVNLFKETPLVYQVDDGKYMIDLPESFRKAKKQ